MRAFACTNCGQLAYFENERCEACGCELGFHSQALELVALKPLEDGSGAYEAIGSGEVVRHCVNHQTAGCNWLTPGEAPGLCESCALGRRIPDLGVPENVALWREAEVAKRRLVYALKRLGLPLARPDGAPLVFDILSDAAEAQPVMTGHDDGLITINLAEADPAEREKRRHDLGEVYRTLLGHFRHEVGHFYWDALVRDGGREEACRQVFGDDRLDYATALKAHYDNGAPPDWQMSFVSPYATMHPWEDFAETWAHYMHIVDALDTAAAFGMRVKPEASSDPSLATRVTGNPYTAESMEALISDWLPLCYAVNSMNRSMGQPDLYPFVLSESAIGKLGYVHDLARDAAVR